MIEFVYQTLESVGFTHPLHPAATHIPMGMVIGAFVFGLAALKWQDLAKTAHYCIILALIGVGPTIIAGIMDWQHRYGGDWENLIVAKFVMASTLTIILAVAVWLKQKEKLGLKGMLLIYGLALLNTVGLGFTGGELQYG